MVVWNKEISGGNYGVSVHSITLCLRHLQSFNPLVFRADEHNEYQLAATRA